MAIDLYTGDIPDPNDPDQFDAASDSYVRWYTETSIPQVNETEANMIALAGAAQSSASGAAASESASAGYAAAAQGAAAGLISTSTTSINTPTTSGVDITITTQAGESWAPGHPAMVARTAAPSASWFTGKVMSYSGTTLVVTSDGGHGVTTGTFTDWTITYNAAGKPVGTREDVWLKTPNKIVTPEVLLQAMEPQTVAYAGSIVLDVATKGFDYRITLTGNPTIGAPSILYDGVTYTLRLKQDGTGGRAPTLNSVWDLGEWSLADLNTAAGKTNLISGPYDADVGKILANVRPAG